MVRDFEFLLTGTEADAVWAAIGPRYTAVPGPPCRRVRVWLDTFDGRLRAAGLTLAYVSGPGGAAASELLLAGAGGTVRQPAALRWPSLLDALPPGQVADRLRPVVGVRALLPVAKVRSELGEWRILNADEKTVVRAYLDRAVLATDGAALPGRISLVPVRGYDDQAARIARMLGALSGLSAEATAEVDLVAGPAAGQAKPDTALCPGQDAAPALARLLLHMLTTVELNVPGVIDDVDTEFLHDLRVSVRRTRSVLKLAGDVLPGELATAYGGEFKWLGDLTTPMRDLDVLLLEYPALAGELVEADPADLDPLLAHLRAQRAVERRRLLRGLRSARFTELAAGWRAALTPVANPGRRRRRAAPAAVPVDTQTLAAERIARAWRRVARRAGSVTPDSPPVILHDLRKRCKELRYVLELFAGVCEPQPYRALLRDLKAVQDSLGEFQDAEVHRDSVRGYAVQMLAAQRAGAPTLLAMGELVARYGARQRLAGSASVARVRDLVTQANRQRAAELVVAA